jgi:hypothetical protein
MTAEKKPRARKRKIATMQHEGSTVKIRNQIARIFDEKAFERPLFYAFPRGLRFELSEGGSMLEQFLLALQKGQTICSDIFTIEESLTVCLRFRAEQNVFKHKPLLNELRIAGIKMPSEREIWVDGVEVDDRLDETQAEWNVHVAFRLPLSSLKQLLWCAFARDFGPIRPRLSANIYLFNLSDRIVVWPYDDRGMDVVGPNHGLLKFLYAKYNRFLLAHDRDAMDDTFAE